MGLSARIFVAYFLLVGLAAILFLQTVTDELTPGMRQSLEEVLVDTANLLAELAREDLEQGKPGDGFLAQGMAAFSQRRLNAVIYSLHKREPGLIPQTLEHRCNHGRRGGLRPAENPAGFLSNTLCCCTVREGFRHGRDGVMCNRSHPLRETGSFVDRAKPLEPLLRPEGTVGG